MVIEMRCSCKYRDALLQRKIRSSYFVLRSPRFGGNKKKPIVSGNEGTRSATAERAAVPQVAEKRITCVAIGIRNHPRERIADAMVLIVRRCQASGPSQSPKIFTVPITVTVLPISRDPSSSSEIEVIIVH
jgi:hypothetical protein